MAGQGSRARTVVLSDPAAPTRHRPCRTQTPDAVRFWADDACGGIEATYARLVRHRFRPHTHDGLMLGLIEAGTKAFARERATHVAAPGSVSVVNPGDLHTGRRADGEELRYRALYVPAAVLAEAAGLEAGQGPPPAFRSGVLQDGSLFRALVDAHDAVVQSASLLTREHLLLDALGQLARRHGSFGNKPDAPVTSAPAAVRQARALLEENFAGEVSIADVAAAVRLSPYHLMRQFRRHVGLPMHAFQLQTRVAHGRRLLAQGVPVVQVALTVGFADQSHFTKRFKDLVGASPAAYQREIRT